MLSNTSKYSFIVFSILSLIKGGAAGYVCNEGEIGTPAPPSQMFSYHVLETN